jgi:hypothetical protein
MSLPNDREVAEAAWYIRDAIEQLDNFYDGFVDRVALKETLHQALEFLGVDDDEG